MVFTNQQRVVGFPMLESLHKNRLRCAPFVHLVLGYQCCQNRRCTWRVPRRVKSAWVPRGDAYHVRLLASATSICWNIFWQLEVQLCSIFWKDLKCLLVLNGSMRSVRFILWILPCLICLIWSDIIICSDMLDPMWSNMAWTWKDNSKLYLSVSSITRVLRG